MHRFYLPPSECKTERLVLTGREAHHALHALRIRCRECVTVLDGAGSELLCEVEHCEQNKVRLNVRTRKSVSRPPFRITLIQAVPKGKIIESIIQKATELGVSRVVPLLSERVIMRLDEKDAIDKSNKWQEVAIEAIKQCGSAWLPKIEAPQEPKKFLARQENFDLPLIASLQSGSRHPREYFDAYQKRNGRPPQSISVWVGPEGDFTAVEIAAAESDGARPITLGQLVLRVETAATYCLSVLNYELAALSTGRD
jgi:16S rRNA (uracil1498-N3)-methyltransferase